MIPRAHIPPVGGGRSTARRNEWLWQLVFLGAHIPFALLIPKRSDLMTGYALLVLAIGVAIAATTRRWERVAYVAAYITGAEVFWRMRKADVPWEFAKYAVVLVLAISIIRAGQFRRAGLPLAYFLLLVPSAALTMLHPGDEEALGQLSFNLSGPLSLAVCTIFFSRLRLTRREMRWVYVALIGPTLSIAAVAAEVLSERMPEQFGNDSNAIASGGFGPNQVSAALGLGILAAILYVMLRPGNALATVAFGVVILFLFRQCVITFSRGGLYMAVGGVAAAAFYLARDQQMRRRLIGAMAVILPIVFFVIWPRLMSLTSGAIGERFGDVEPTGRDVLAMADLKTWAENPILGIGPGLGGPNRLAVHAAAAAHTEYTRMVAEHGLLGLASLVILFVMGLRILRAASTRMAKALAAAMLAYSVLSLSVDGMRLVAPGFAFGISSATLASPRRRRASVAQAGAGSRLVALTREAG